MFIYATGDGSVFLSESRAVGTAARGSEGYVRQALPRRHWHGYRAGAVSQQPLQLPVVPQPDRNRNHCDCPCVIHPYLEHTRILGKQLSQAGRHRLCIQRCHRPRAYACVQGDDGISRLRNKPAHATLDSSALSADGYLACCTAVCRAQAERSRRCGGVCGDGRRAGGDDLLRQLSGQLRRGQRAQRFQDRQRIPDIRSAARLAVSLFQATQAFRRQGLHPCGSFNSLHGLFRNVVHRLCGRLWIRQPGWPLFQTGGLLPYLPGNTCNRAQGALRSHFPRPQAGRTWLAQGPGCTGGKGQGAYRRTARQRGKMPLAHP